jgi:HNH endonuclease
MVKRSKLWFMEIDGLRRIVAQSMSFADAMRRLGYKTMCQSQIDVMKRVFMERGISTDHFMTRRQLISHHANLKASHEVDRWLADEPGFNPVVSGWQMELRAPIRKWLLHRAGNKCQLCGWGQVNIFTGKTPLQIHHVDGDAKNNRPNNLQVVCPNCHSLTENFGRRGGGSRVARYACKAKKA